MFDPEALERGAKALREINQSPHAKRVIDLSKAQEATKQQEGRTKEAEYQHQAALAQREQERVRWEEQRKAMQQDMQQKAELARYNDDLARKRVEFEHAKGRERNAEVVALQEESTRRQEAEKQRAAAQIEAERRATDEHRAELQKQVEAHKAIAEAEGRIKEGRDNEDINRRALLMRLDEERKKLLEAINATFGHLGGGATALLTDTNMLTAAVAGLTLLALGVYTAREGTRVAGRVFDRWLGTPRLVRETSRRRLFGSGIGGHKSSEEVRRDFGDIVMQPVLQERVRSLAASTANTKRHGAAFRHMLFYGPPGTGKTMAAKRMARTAGLDYAIMSGGDVAPLKGGAVSQLHEMFDWAERSRRGLMLFIDEADAFLGHRGSQMSEGMRGALNATLYRTGDQSRDFVVVLATNRPADLDPAMLDRMDELLEFPLPGENERARILAIYLESYILKAGTAAGAGGSGTATGPFARLALLLRGRRAGADTIQVEGITASHIAQAAKITQGFSGRELAKLMASMQAAAYATKGAALTAPLFESVLHVKVQEHKRRGEILMAGAAQAAPIILE
ncbi:hypothetical protein WJX73_007444 [Symbiochloris irregularis]|uniref:AAA+ ATPase domain-containing protein n=1 Tax=Symbiochloris irregularis TaxID=706552 RepID=A0AAW1NPM3_9CHLO